MLTSKRLCLWLGLCSQRQDAELQIYPEDSFLLPLPDDYDLNYLNDVIDNSRKCSWNISYGISVTPSFTFESGCPMIVPPFNIINEDYDNK